MTEKEKMLAGILYDPFDSELTELLPNTPNLPNLQAPIYFDYGCNTYFGKFSGTNFNFTCLDVCPVHIGDNVMIDRMLPWQLQCILFWQLL